MLVTSKDANKLLKQLNEELSSILKKEADSKTFNAAISEQVENVRPEYNYKSIQENINILQNKIIKIKHAINMFNVSTIVPEFNMTIDEILIYIPQLTATKQKLAEMKDKPKMERVNLYGRSVGNIIDYVYTNYDASEVEKDYLEVSNKLANAQIALDKINVSKTFEIDI